MSDHCHHCGETIAPERLAAVVNVNGRDVPSCEVCGCVREDWKTRESVRAKIVSAPSYPALVKACVRFWTHLHGKGGYSERRTLECHREPWLFLTAHAGVWDANSATCKTMKRLADAVFAETGLPREQCNGFRGDKYRIDWEQLARQTA